MDADLLAAAVITTEWTGVTLPSGAPAASGGAEAEAERLVGSVTAACDTALPRRSHPRGRPPVYWWSDSVAVARAECVRRKRLWIRRRGLVHDGSDSAAVAERAYREARKELKHRIRESKAKCWAELVKTVEDNPWGKPYKVVMKKLRGPPATATMEPQTVRDIAAILFPQGDRDGEPADLVGVRSEDVPEFSLEEVSTAVGRFGSRCRAPGPDGIPNRIWSVVHAVNPGRLTDVFNLCLREGVFPGRWKRARLALLAKPGKPEGMPSSYRPLCLLDDVGKIFEFLLATRMNNHMSATGVGLSEWQFGFRSGRCTDDALRLLRERLLAAEDARRYTVAVSLDIRNAFNTVGWGVVRAALARMDFPPYVRRVLDSYLSGRVLHVCDDSGGDPVTVEVTCGVPQGSVLGPLLWNVAYDTVFRLPLPAGVTVIGYADDTLVVSEGNTLSALEDRANAALAVVAGCIRDLGLRLAVDKTEAVVFKAQYGPADLRLRIGDQAVQLCAALKYLGVVHEGKGMWYNAHYRAAADKSRRIMAALRGLMPNIGGPREPRRRLLLGVVHSVMLYGAPTWGSEFALSRTGPKMLASVQRLAAISSVSAYRTVSYDAATVVARTVPIVLMAQERHLSFEIRRAMRPTGTDDGGPLPPDGPTEAAPANDPHSLRARVLAKWAREIEETEVPADSGREWTRTLIPPDLLCRWVSRTYGEMSFHLTQLMTGHGCFNRYLRKINRAPFAGCSHCGPPDGYAEEVDDALHTLLRCEAFRGERERLVGVIGPFDPGGLVPKMLDSPANWDAVARFARAVMTAKEAAERDRQFRQGIAPSKRRR